MGCDPLLRAKSNCTSVTANLLRAHPCFPHPIRPSATLCPEIVTESTNGRSLEQPPVAGPEPVATTDETCGEARDRSGVGTVKANK